MDKARLSLAKRYARACLKVAADRVTAADIDAFEDAATFFKTHQQACFLMDLSLLSESSKKQALQLVIEKYKLPHFAMQIFLLIITHRRSSLIAQVLFYFVQLYREQVGIVSFSVESSVALSDQEKKEIEHFLKEQVQREIVCTYTLNKDLIAGLRMYNEKYLWEHSAQAQLRALYTSVKR